MNDINLDELIERVGSRFLLVSIIIKRVNKLSENQVDYRKKAYIEKVLKEIYNGEIIFELNGEKYDTKEKIKLN